MKQSLVRNLISSALEDGLFSRVDNMDLSIQLRFSRDNLDKVTGITIINIGGESSAVEELVSALC